MRDRRITCIDDLRKACEDHHATVSQTAKGLRVRGPGGVAFINSNWGDPRARENAIHDVKRYAGIDVTVPAQRTGLGAALVDAAVKRTAKAAVDTAPPKLIVEAGRPALENGDTLDDAPAPAAPADPPAAPRDDVAALEDLVTETVGALEDKLAALSAEVAELRAELARRPAPDTDDDTPVDPLAAQRATVAEFVDRMPDGLRMRASFIAEQTALPSATVRTVLKDAVKAGELAEQRGQGRGRPSTYNRPAPAVRGLHAAGH